MANRTKYCITIAKFNLAKPKDFCDSSGLTLD